MSPLPEHPFTAYVGIDWADTKHDICLQAAGETRREFCCIRHQVAAIDEWANTLYLRFGGPVAVALELSKGPIVAALQKYEFLVLFPINPATLAKYREAFQPSGAKDDPADAELALDLLVRHPERFSPLRPQSALMRSLVSLVERRRQLVGDQNRLTNRLCDTLKQYYPQALEWFDDRGTVLFCDFLERWPTLRSVRQARTAVLERFFHAHHCRSASRISARIESIRAAAALTEDPAIIGPCRLHVLALVAQLRAVLAAIVQFNLEIAQVACTLPDYALFESLPVLVPGSPHACWLPSVSSGSVSGVQMNCRSTRVSPR
jgi:transposase